MIDIALLPEGTPRPSERRKRTLRSRVVLIAKIAVLGVLVALSGLKNATSKRQHVVNPNVQSQSAVSGTSSPIG